MLKLTNNYATSSDRLTKVKLTNGMLTYWKGEDTPVIHPFAVDFLTLQDGWVKFTKGAPAEYLLQPAEIEWTQDERNAMIADGWQYLICARIKSREFPSVGLAELQIKNSKPLIDAFNALYKTFVEHGPEGGVPMVSHVMNALGDQSFTIHGFVTRPAIFGQPINTLPQLNGAQPAPEAGGNTMPTPLPKPAPLTATPAPEPAVDPKRDRLLAMLKNRKPKTDPNI